MKLIVSYIKMHSKSILLFLLFTLLFYIVFSLYDISLEAVSYATLLCISFGLIFAAFDFWRFCKRHKLLFELKNRITIRLMELPVPENLIEGDYQTLIETLFHDKMKLVSIADNARSELTDYYTLWAHQIKTPIAAMRLLFNRRNASRTQIFLWNCLKLNNMLKWYSSICGLTALHLTL